MLASNDIIVFQVTFALLLLIVIGRLPLVTQAQLQQNRLLEEKKKSHRPKSSIISILCGVQGDGLLHS